MSYEFFIGMRHTLAGRHDRFVSFVSLVSALGIALGVAALLVVLAVMTGFQNELRARILGVASHLEAVAADGIPDWRPVAATLLAHPQVLAAAPNISEQALLVRGQAVRGAAVKGVLPDEEVKVSDLHNRIVAGAPGGLRPGAYNILLGEGLADRLGAAPGDRVMLVAPRGRLTAAGLLPRLRQFQVAAVFNSGVHEYDANLAYIHLDDARKLYRLPPGAVSSVRLKLRDLLQAPRLRGELQRALPDPLYLYDWTASHGNLFRALALEKRVMFVILALIIAVAAFNIVSALVTAVRNKRADIAILRAMGASAAGIARIFLLQGLLVGCGGLLIGLAAGLPLAANAGAIVGLIEKMFGHALFPGNIYQLGELPSQIVAADVAVVCAAAFVLSLAAAAYPAWRAARLPPAESLRHE